MLQYIERFIKIGTFLNALNNEKNKIIRHCY